MTDQSKSADKLRYRLYYRLMDLCLLAYVLGITITIVDHALTLNLEEQTGFWREVLRWSTGLLTYFLGGFLILARFMRDEYAQLLWHRAASVMLYLIVLVPIILYASAWATYFVYPSEEPPLLFRWLAATPSAHLVINLIFGGAVLAYVVIFQFLRWKDSR